MSLELTAKSILRTPCLKVLICLLLSAATITVYWQVIGFDLITMDDRQYILENSALSHGVSLEGIRWAFSSFYAANWHPLTWISHMIDVQIFGLKPGMHHLTSVFFHLLNVILLFLVLDRMTGASWRSGAVAALFAVHPLHVESVAWIAERKDVLSTFFWMLTMMSYLWYVQKRTINRYLVLILFFILGLLSKPMLVTLPFVLLLLDFWPLKRMGTHQSGGLKKDSDNITFKSEGWGSRLSALIFEKIPLFIFAIVSCGITMLAQRKWGAVSSMNVLDLSIRLANVITSYTSYLWKMIWPLNLALFYPYPEVIHPMAIMLCAILLLFITALVLFLATKFPYLVVGWLWYIGTLVPVIGIVQVGSQSMADRYTYIPLVGIFIMIVWGLGDLFNRWRLGKAVLGVIFACVLTLLLVATWVQVGFWKNSETLWKHTLAVTKNNYKAHTDLGISLIISEDFDGAIREFQQALRIKPISDAYNGLGTAYAMKKQEEVAIGYFSKGIQLDPYNVNIRNNLGLLLASLDRTDEAIEQFKELLKINANEINTHFNLGKALLQRGNAHGAIIHLNEALLMDPHNTDVLNSLEKAKVAQKELESSISIINEALKSEPQNPDLYTRIGDLYFQQEEFNEAIIQYQKAISVQPSYIKAMFGLVLVYSARKESAKVLDVLQNMRQIEPDNPKIYYNIACLYAKENDIKKSIDWLKQAIEKGFNDYDLIKKDPDLANIRNTALINELINNH